ncbi:MAG: RnfH family protein [Candidatus Berkiella sp.]
MIKIEVAAATTQLQKIIAIEIDANANIRQAIELSDILSYFTDFPTVALLEACGFSVGIYSKAATMDTVLQDGDRVEIYLPLKQSAIDARKARVQQKKARQKVRHKKIRPTRFSSLQD